jgi:hypothetical protein
LVFGTNPVDGMSVLILTVWVEIDAPLWQLEQVWLPLAGEPDLPPEGPDEFVSAGRLARAKARMA